MSVLFDRLIDHKDQRPFKPDALKHAGRALARGLKRPFNRAPKDCIELTDVVPTAKSTSPVPNQHVDQSQPFTTMIDLRGGDPSNPLLTLDEPAKRSSVQSLYLVTS
jgi:hypothetical protein